MKYLTYLSSAVRSLSQEDLENLLDKARQKNQLLGITGLLVYRGGNFIQYIEGEETTLNNLYSSICRDKRHKDQIILQQGEINERLFGQWSMDLRTFKNNSIFTTAELEQDPDGIKRELEEFVRTMR